MNEINIKNITVLKVKFEIRLICLNQKVEMNLWICFLLKWIDQLKWIFDSKIVKVYWLIEIKNEPNGSFKGEQFWVFWEKWIDWLY